MQRAATVAPSGPAPFSFTDGDRICDTDVPGKTAHAVVVSTVAVAAMAVVSWWWGYSIQGTMVQGVVVAGGTGLEHKV